MASSLVVLSAVTCLRNQGLTASLVDVSIHLVHLFSYCIIPCGKFGSPYLGKVQELQEQRYPFLSVCAVFLCVQTMAWLPAFGIFNVRTDVDACDCTRVLYGHRKRVCTEFVSGFSVGHCTKGLTQPLNKPVFEARLWDVSGFPYRHEFQDFPKGSEKAALYWPGEDFFDQVRPATLDLLTMRSVEQVRPTTLLIGWLCQL